LSRLFRSAHHHGFDQSGLRWLGISDLIAEPEGSTFISYKVARRRLDRLRFVTQDPKRTFTGLVSCGVLFTSGRRMTRRNLFCDSRPDTERNMNKIKAALVIGLLVSPVLTLAVKAQNAITEQEAQSLHWMRMSISTRS
jgi:hypothetical protein